MQEKRKKIIERFKKINSNLVITIIFSLLFFGAIIYKNKGILYAMNDDIVMKSIASGIFLGGEPSPQLIFSVFPFNIIVFILYKITIKLDWYGIILVGSTIFYLIYTVYNVIKHKESIVEKIVYTCIIFFVASSLYNTFLIDITFTVVAFFVTTCCLILYMLPASKLKNVIMSIGIFLAFGIRAKSCLIVLVFFLPVFLYKNMGNKEGLKKDFILGLKIGITLLICIIVQKLMVSNQEWKEYLAYNENRSLFFDYYYGAILSLPEEEKTELFYRAGLDKQEMEILCTYGEIGFIDNMQEKMANLIQECENYGLKIGNNFKEAFLYMMKNTKLAKYYLITVFLLGYYVIKSKDRKKKIPIYLLFLIFQFGILSYLVYGGRLPDRVLIPTFATYIIVNMATLISEVEVQTILKKILNYDKVFFIIMSIILYAFSIKHIDANLVIRNAVDTSNEILEYFAKYPDNIYIYDKFTLEKFKVVNQYPMNNYINMSGWCAFTPSHEERIKKCGVSSLKELVEKDNVYLVIPEPYTPEEKEERYQYLFGEVEIELVDKVNENYICKIKNKKE